MNRLLTVLKWTGLGLVGLAALAAGSIYAISAYKINKSYASVPLTAIAVPTDPAALREGGRLTSLYHCASCHGEGMLGQLFLDVPNVFTLYAPNLTTSIPTYSDAELARVLRHAVKKDGHNAWMFASPMYYQISDTDLGRMIGYLRTLKPVATPALPASEIKLLARIGLATGKFMPMADLIDHTAARTLSTDTSQSVRGKYLVMTICSGCHGGPELQGNKEMKSPALMIATAYSPGKFRRFMRTGEGGLTKKDCGEMSVMCRRHFRQFNDSEIGALWSFLQTLPGKPVAGR